MSKTSKEKEKVVIYPPEKVERVLMIEPINWVSTDTKIKAENEWLLVLLAIPFIGAFAILVYFMVRNKEVIYVVKK